MSTASESLAQRIIAKIFAGHFKPGMVEVAFQREELVAAAETLGEPRPKNLGDIIYSLRYRVPLPDSVREAAPPNSEWAIFPGGNAVYVLRAVPFNLIEPRMGIRTVRLPDSTPGVIAKYAMTDEQALLARLRYNRLLDVFTGLACYPLQSHLRTSVTVENAIDGTRSSSQVETDDLYVGLDQHGAHYVLPVQAKGGADALSVIQVWQDFRVAEQKFPDLLARPIAAQFMANNEIALFEFEESDDRITIAREQHYELVAPDQLTAEELKSYRQSASQNP
ncbi:endonuclease [Candidatus Poriferisocius sp.]|uniref:endonuclease n=1 Tax=Candidatus Poriferisocius sp. TaxID=3101276 RepID=UPI003B5A143C